VAIFFGLKSGKSESAVNEQLKALIDEYADEMVRSKKLNNEYFSPRILKDQDILKKIQPLVFALASTIDEEQKKRK
jgi:hypothetical protein